MAKFTNVPYRTPTASKLAADLGVDDPTARHIRRILCGESDPRGVEATDRWVRACFHDPRWQEQAQHAADVLAGTHGVEAVADASDATRWPRFTYLNAGDTYTATLVFKGTRAAISTLGEELELD